MNRRDWLKTALAASLYSGWCHQPTAAATRSAARNETILVLGAGMAGLAAARGLAAAGHRVTVIEGRDRLGGRIWTDRRFASPIDLGAAWIHGTSGNPITQLAKEAGARTQVTDFDDLQVHDADGRRLAESELEEIADALEELLGEVVSLGEDAERDLSIRAAIDRVLQGERLDAAERRALGFALSSLVVTAGAELHELSLWYSDADDSFAGPDALLPGGYDQLVQHLARGLDVRLQNCVSQVHYGGSHVRVTTDQGEYEADRAVVTFPLGVFKKGTVTFTPPLPAAKRQSIERLAMGVLNKVVLEFPSRFWPQEPDFLGYMSGTDGEFPEFLNVAGYTGKPILVALTGGDFARRLEPLSDEQVAQRALRVLKKIHGGAIPDPRQVAVTRWSADRFACGSYSHVPVGATAADFDRLSEPVAGGRLLFAGEATHRRYPGTVHGAFLSGVREAQRVTELHR